MSESVVDINQYKYDQAERDLRAKLVEYSERPEIQSQTGEAFYIWKDDPEFLSEDITEDEVDDITFEKFLDWFLFDFRLLDTEERVIERFYNDERETLTEIEDAMLAGWRESVYSFFEVTDVVPGESCKIRDLFDDEILNVRDSASSKKLRPGDIIGARPISAGAHTYFSGVISAYPPDFKDLILEFFNTGFKEYRKAGGGKKTKKDYLRDLGFQIGHYLEDFANDPHFVTSEGDELVIANSVYEVPDPAQVLDIIRKDKSLKELSAPHDDIKIFTLGNGVDGAVTGTIELEGGILRMQCHSAAKLGKARKKIEKDLGGLVSHQKDTLKDPDKFIVRKKETKKRKGRRPAKPPAGVKNKAELENALEYYYDKWIDEPHQALNGLTPRHAAETAEGRDELNRILKELELFYKKQAADPKGPSFTFEKIKKQLKLK